MALIFGIIVILFLILIAVLAPLIYHVLAVGPARAPNGDFNLIDPLAGNLPKVGPPNHGFTWSHPLGSRPPNAASTTLAFLLYGLRTDMSIGLLATVVSMIIGIVLGLIAGFSAASSTGSSRSPSTSSSRFPFLLGAISLAPIITSHFASNQSALDQGPDLRALIGILVFFGWMGLARLIRGYVISLREREFIQAAQVIGAPDAPDPLQGAAAEHGRPRSSCRCR